MGGEFTVDPVPIGLTINGVMSKSYFDLSEDLRTISYAIYLPSGIYSISARVSPDDVNKTEPLITFTMTISPPYPIVSYTFSITFSGSAFFPTLNRGGIVIQN